MRSPALNASLASKMELTTSAVLDASAKTKGSSAGLRMELLRIGGPLSKKTTTSYLNAFQALSDTKAGWFAVCALEPLAGHALAAMSEDSPEGCASKCLSLSSGTNACAAFNYQSKDGLATLGCYASGSFVAGHPKGPLGVEVVKKVVKE